MAKTYTLPITCNHLLRVFAIIFHIFIIGITIVLYLEKLNPIWMAIAAMGWSIILAIWLLQFIMWGGEGKLPSIRCKCEDDE